jgi:hypothetical protein
MAIASVLPASLAFFKAAFLRWVEEDRDRGAIYLVAQHNNGMHPTRDTTPVIFRQRLGRAGDAWRYAAYLML